jgi:succinate dehydrogenase / fumarate reductase flavoprotein subunit
MIRTLQNHAIHQGIDVFMECKVVRLMTDGGAVSGALAYWRESGKFVTFNTKAVILATGGIGKAWKVTSNSWEYTGDGQALALWAGADLIDMEFAQFHPTGMVWPPSVRGILVTEGVRGDGGTLRNSDGKRFMFDYVPEVFRAETAETEEEADLWYEDHSKARRTPDLLPRDEVARAINSEVKAGRGSPHGGAFLDIASRRDAAYIKRRLPSMYHQFKQLADVDITETPMEVGPTLHYVMGGVRVDPDTAAATIPGLYAAGEAAAGMHGSNRLGGNSLGDLLVFGRRAGLAAAQYAAGLTSTPRLDPAEVDHWTQKTLEPFGRDGGENPYTIQMELQDTMQVNVGIIRTESEMLTALAKIDELKERATHLSVGGGRRFNPGWHLALDLRNMLLVSECVARAALMRQESRGGHTRDDYPAMDPSWRQKLLICSGTGDGPIKVEEEELASMRADLLGLFQRDELKKYLTEQEMAAISSGTEPGTQRGTTDAGEGA